MEGFLAGGNGVGPGRPNDKFIESVERNPRRDACEISISGELGELMRGGKGLRDPASMESAAFS